MKYQNPKIESSYRENDLGKTLYEQVLKYKPKKVVEFGALFGYSTIAMAMALHELGQGKIVSYDLWDKYPHTHSTKNNTQKNIDLYGLSEYVTLKQGDLIEWLKDPEEFDMMHIDISNKGDIIKMVFNTIKSHIKKGKIILFEGGSKERDNVEWMKKYKCKKISGCSAPYKIINSRFPSLSMLTLKSK